MYTSADDVDQPAEPENDESDDKMQQPTINSGFLICLTTSITMTIKT